MSKLLLLYICSRCNKEAICSYCDIIKEPVCMDCLANSVCKDCRKGCMVICEKGADVLISCINKYNE